MENFKRPLTAYDNPEFLHSTDGRTVRILAEFIEPGVRLKNYNITDTVVFFGSARTKPLKEAKAELKAAKSKKDIAKAKTTIEMAKYYEDAVELSKRLSLWAKKSKIKMAICSGGGPGIMEAANRGAKIAKAASIGLNISLPFEQYPNPFISEHLNFEFHYFFLRKFWFLYHAKALVVFPGGFGTMDELMEVLTLIQTQKIKKDITVCLYGREFWENMVNFKYMVKMGMIDKKDLNLFQYVNSVDEAFNLVSGKMKKLLSKKTSAFNQSNGSMYLSDLK